MRPFFLRAFKYLIQFYKCGVRSINYSHNVVIYANLEHSKGRGRLVVT
jgi:hypothetical protein